MIALLQRAEIRRLFYAEHWPIGTIADALGVHHETVQRALNRARGLHPGPQIRPSGLDPYKAVIATTLEQYPRLRATRLYAMLRERGYPGSAVQVRRYVRTVRPAARAEAFFRLDTLAGEQGQVDWGNFGAIQIGAARRVLSCFVLVLSWSRAVYARFALDQTLESFLRGHVEAFAALGGVPRVLLYDNLKSVVLERFGEHIRFHPRLLELAGHYHFAPQPCAVARGNEKAKASYYPPFRVCDAHWGKRWRSRNRFPGWARGSGPVGGSKRIVPLSSARSARRTPWHAKRLAVVWWTPSCAAISGAVSQPVPRRCSAKLGIPYACRRICTRPRWNGCPVPVRRQRPLSVAAIWASVCSATSARTISTIAAGVRRRSGAPRGRGHSSVVVAPPFQRIRS
jgi:transposase